MKARPEGAEMCPCGLTGMTYLIAAFRNFANVPPPPKKKDTAVILNG